MRCYPLRRGLEHRAKTKDNGAETDRRDLTEPLTRAAVGADRGAFRIYGLLDRARDRGLLPKP
jgi:hypothetical protein